MVLRHTAARSAASPPRPSASPGAGGALLAGSSPAAAAPTYPQVDRGAACCPSLAAGPQAWVVPGVLPGAPPLLADALSEHLFGKIMTRCLL
jgi:hypothetical protein